MTAYHLFTIYDATAAGPGDVRRTEDIRVRSLRVQGINVVFTSHPRRSSRTFVVRGRPSMSNRGVFYVISKNLYL